MRRRRGQQLPYALGPAVRWLVSAMLLGLLTLTGGAPAWAETPAPPAPSTTGPEGRTQPVAVPTVTTAPSPSSAASVHSAALPTATETIFDPGAGTRPPPTSSAADRVVVLVAVPGLRWSDIDPTRTPTLWQVAAGGAVGTLSVRSVLSPTCVVDAWLMVGAGRKISDAAQSPPCPAPDEPVDGHVPGWDRIRLQAAAEEGRPVPGLLGSRLAAASVRVSAIGPGAALATAGKDGRVTAHYVPGDVEPAAALRRALTTRPQLLVVDPGRVWTSPERSQRADQVAAVERYLEVLRPGLPEGATLILAGTGSSDADPRLGVLAMTGTGADGERIKVGVLGSGSSRQTGLLQVPDLTATILELLDQPIPPEVAGSPVHVVAQQGSTSQETIENVSDLDRSASTMSPISPWVVGAVLLANIGLYLLAWWALHRQRARVLAAVADDARRGGAEAADVALAEERRHLARLRYGALVVGALPVVTFLATLIPWWRTSLPGLALVGVLACLAVAAMTVALTEPWRSWPAGPGTALGGLTAGLLALDAVSGSYLQLDPLLGGGQRTSGRFVGMTDAGAGLLLVGALLFAAGLAERLVDRGRRDRAAQTVGACGLATVLVLGLPFAGDHPGMVLAAVPSFLLLGWAVSQRRLSWRVVAAVALVGLLVTAGLAVLELQRPAAQRGRLGRLASGLAHGTAGDVVSHKLDAAVSATVGSAVSLLLPIALGAAFLVLLRRAPGSTGTVLRTLAGPGRMLSRAGWAVLAALVISPVVCDSGLVVPAMSLLLVLPVTFAACAQERLDTLHAGDYAVVRGGSPVPRGRWDIDPARPMTVAPAWPEQALEENARVRGLPR